MATVAVTDATFDTEVKNSEIPVVVDFWAEWCGPCKQIGPALEELAMELEGKVKIAKVDVDTNPNAAASMGVRGIPALFIFKDGEVVSNRAGAAPKAALQSWIEESIQFQPEKLTCLIANFLLFKLEYILSQFLMGQRPDGT